MDEGGPVPGRECGACTVCCVVFDITEPSIAKPAGTPCRHLVGQGCAIHPTRPDVCRNWLCGWRLLAGLPDSWRPDLSGILVYQMACAEPGYVPDAFIIALSRGPAHFADMTVLGFIEHMVRVRLPLYMTLQAGKMEARSIFLNRTLEPMVAARDWLGLVAALTALMERLQQG